MTLLHAHFPRSWTPIFVVEVDAYHVGVGGALSQCPGWDVQMAKPLWHINRLLIGEKDPTPLRVDLVLSWGPAPPYGVLEPAFTLCKCLQGCLENQPGLLSVAPPALLASILCKNGKSKNLFCFLFSSMFWGFLLIKFRLYFSLVYFLQVVLFICFACHRVTLLPSTLRISSFPSSNIYCN